MKKSGGDLNYVAWYWRKRSGLVKTLAQSRIQLSTSVLPNTCFMTWLAASVRWSLMYMIKYIYIQCRAGYSVHMISKFLWWSKLWNFSASQIRNKLMKLKEIKWHFSVSPLHVANLSIPIFTGVSIFSNSFKILCLEYGNQRRLFTIIFTTGYCNKFKWKAFKIKFSQTSIDDKSRSETALGTVRAGVHKEQ